MIALDAVHQVVGVLVLAGASAPACPVVPPPRVEIAVIAAETRIRHDMTMDQLKAAAVDTALPHQMRELSHVGTGGVMSGDIHVRYDVAASAVPGNTAETVGMNCVRYDVIKVTLEMEPVIFIASDYAPGSCWYNLVLEHERAHVDMDRVVIEKYAGRIRDGLILAFSEPGDAIQGPVAPKKVDSLKKVMGEQVVKMTDGLVVDMARERQAVQQSVDSLRGYAFIMNSCYTGDNVVRVGP